MQQGGAMKNGDVPLGACVKGPYGVGAGLVYVFLPRLRLFRIGERGIAPRLCDAVSAWLVGIRHYVPYRWCSSCLSLCLVTVNSDLLCSALPDIE